MELFEVDQTFAVAPEDHSHVLAVYTGVACLLALASLSVGVRRLWGASHQAQPADDVPTQWELLEQASSDACEHE